MSLKSPSGWTSFTFLKLSWENTETSRKTVSTMKPTSKTHFDSLLLNRLAWIFLSFCVQGLWLVIQLSRLFRYNEFLISTESMKRKAFNLAVEVPRLANLRRTNRTIHNFINRIPCYKEDLTIESSLLTYLRKEMECYPMTAHECERIEAKRR